jgi:membrane-associated protease RseP (regulator of RpoE activity)
MDANKAHAFSSKTWWKRALVLVAGVGMNFLLAIVLFTGIFLVGAKPLVPNFLSEKEYHSFFLPSIESSLVSGYIQHDGILLQPLNGGIAEKAGTLSGDILRTINTITPSSIPEFTKIVQQNTTLTLEVLRGTGIILLTLSPTEGKIQSYISYKNLRINPEYKKELNLIDALEQGTRETLVASIMTFDLLGNTFQKLLFPKNEIERNEAKESISGPIGMGAGFIKMIEVGTSIQTLLLICAFLSINL